jgi:hypothetical protein
VRWRGAIFGMGWETIEAEFSGQGSGKSQVLVIGFCIGNHCGPTIQGLGCRTEEFLLEAELVDVTELALSTPGAVEIDLGLANDGKGPRHLGS